MLVSCMNLKSFGKVFTSKFVGIYRAAISQGLRNTAADNSLWKRLWRCRKKECSINKSWNGTFHREQESPDSLCIHQRLTFWVSCSVPGSLFRYLFHSISGLQRGTDTLRQTNLNLWFIINTCTTVQTQHISNYVEIKCQLDATDDIYCRFYFMLNMFRAILCPSSGAREYYTDGRCLWYLVLWFSGCRYGVQLKVMCPVCSCKPDT